MVIVSVTAIGDEVGINREIVREPEYTSKPRYCMLLLGEKAKAPVWIVQDGKKLYVDQNANRDLTDDGGPILPTNVREIGAPTVTKRQFEKPKVTGRKWDGDYLLDEITPADGSRHSKFRLLRWNYGEPEDGYGLSLRLNGEIPMYAGWTPIWAESPAAASVIHFGGMVQPKLLRMDDFVVDSGARRLSIAFVNYGHGPGAHSRLSMFALPESVIPIAHIEWPVAPGAKRLVTTHPLNERCCYWEFYNTKFQIPQSAVAGKAIVTIELSDKDFPLRWASKRTEVPVRLTSDN